MSVNTAFPGATEAPVELALLAPARCTICQKRPRHYIGVCRTVVKPGHLFIYSLCESCAAVHGVAETIDALIETVIGSSDPRGES